MSQYNYIGQGAKFPLQVSKKYGSQASTKIAQGIDKINDSILLILSTPLGERVMNPEFGSRLNDLVFEPNDTILKDLAELYIAEALARWEPRIIVESIVPVERETEISDENNVLYMSITYKIRATGQVGNYVYPIYLQPMPYEDTILNNRNGTNIIR